MSNVLQELIDDDLVLDPLHIQQRVEDWRDRVAALYRSIVDWMPHFRNDQSESVEMHEELMQAYGVGPIRLPILQLWTADGICARFVPRGLWIVGGNGRIDLFARSDHFILFDRAENFSSPLWDIAPAFHRMETKALSKESLQAILA